MNRRMKLIFVAVAVLIFVALSQSTFASDSALPENFSVPPPKIKEGPLKIVHVGVVMNTAAEMVINKIEKEIEKNGGAQFAEYMYMAPSSNVTTLQEQSNILESLAQQDIDAIILATENEEAMIPYIRSAAERGIAVFMDNTPNVTNDNVYFVSNIASEQAEPARKIGEWIVAKYKDKPDVKIAVLEGFPGVVSDRRLEGLKEGIAGHDNIRIVASQPADWTRAKGHDVTENILTAHRDIDIIVGLYDEMALGAVAAVKAKGLLGKVTICGYDHTKDANASIKAGELTCTVDTGYPQKAVLLLNAVKEYCKEGKTVPRYLNPEFRVYDKDNIDTYDTAQFD